MAAIFLETLPHTEEGGKLELNEAQINLCKVVYRHSEEEPDKYVFAELWNPDREYTDEYVIAPLKSVFLRVTEHNIVEGTNFVNIEGSTRDPKPINPLTKKSYGSWRQLMAAKLPDFRSCCAQLNTIYKIGETTPYAGFACTNDGEEFYAHFENGDLDVENSIWIQGAHVWIGASKPKSIEEGKKVYILPLCRAHNTFNGITGRYGTGYYMKIGRLTKAIILDGYLQQEMVQNAILQMKQEKRIVAKGIDVSKYQETIDFEKVKASGIQFVILRAGYGRQLSQKDPYFEKNYAGAKRAGLHVGAYWYSYADSLDAAEAEANVFMQVIRGKQFEYPVYLDLEEQKLLKKGKDFCSSLVERFCKTLEAHRYFAGLYISRSPLQSYIRPEVSRKYSLWIAEYNDSCKYTGQYDMWQYSDHGQINGIANHVDMDYCYRDFPDIICKKHFNGY